MDDVDAIGVGTQAVEDAHPPFHKVKEDCDDPEHESCAGDCEGKPIDDGLSRAYDDQND